ncbi:Diphthamide biosynthesis protein 2 [Neurospora intermedia]|uniref:2-(3-amino-3-carboxypropyl)histidine synthase subunit 2 n=1 Tax=Neurospora intermedia TaxID=5142 RepID=A0ABR3D6I2_NEUIN
MAGELNAAPVLSTPEDHLFEYAVVPTDDQTKAKSDDELRDIYEITRTAKEVGEGGWRRIGLQFPDHMLCDAPRVVQLLEAELASLPQPPVPTSTADSQLTATACPEPSTTNNGQCSRNFQQNGTGCGCGKQAPAPVESQPKARRVYVLADTSYSACCVDEIAAEHVNADVVVHYGRSCLSPTSRLPVIYVFTKHILDRDAALADFEKEYPDKEAKVVLMADVTYQVHVLSLLSELQSRGYVNLLATEIVHNPMGRIPNRKVVDVQGKEVEISHGSETSTGLDLRDYSIFHISQPPTALLLALCSRVKNLYIFPTSSDSSSLYSAQRLLGRRYARLLSLTTAGIIGILVNTLSVSNYLSSIDSIRKQIAAAGKKSYTMVVGKLNPAKLANFAEIDGWVVVGCWESSLIEDDAGFYKPVITPFELELALARDDERVWTGEWWGGIEAVKPPIDEKPEEKKSEDNENNETQDTADTEQASGDGELDSEEESAPPEFDWRTGKLVSHSRPMRMAASKPKSAKKEDSSEKPDAPPRSSALTLRSKAQELASVNGVVSPGAEYLRTQRTWVGLGTDFDEEATMKIEEGRGGVARGYTVGGEGEKHLMS